ncbi:TetR/AcrR family transcriptional regulator [Leptospira limi]|uniref:TetR/AcrR family transcriptional regulator n=1 Tax=Leptospira limi TaxID=2950023 RepID=A0ABT3M0Y9_9LEPT|nr:TetR/AcrR family transcriptional regulator [Leptospira limi]MCW7463430.1 TetR/AcrR family transcriptional regulator [Leptospira limi]
MKEELVRNAVTILKEQGFEELSAISISAACGVSKRTFYKTFNGLDEFLDLLMEIICAEVRQEFDKYLVTSLELNQEKIEEFFSIMPRLFGRHFESFMVHLLKIRPDLVKKFLVFRKTEFKKIAEKIISVNVKNVKKRKISQLVATDILQVLVDQIATPQYLVESGESMKTVANSILQIYLYGIYGS